MATLRWLVHYYNKQHTDLDFDSHNEVDICSIESIFSASICI